MYEDELMTTVRESFTGLHSATPVERIVSRSRAVRNRRRIPVAAGTLALAAGAALAVTALPASHQPGRPAAAQLAAWTVARQANGDIDVTINQLNDPAALQRTLRADGLPVNVSFSGAPLGASCQPYAASREALSAVAKFSLDHGRAYLVIDPSALPSGSGVSIFDDPGAGRPPVGPGTYGHGSPPPGITGPLSISLVYASQQCTG